MGSSRALIRCYFPPHLLEDRPLIWQGVPQAMLLPLYFLLTSMLQLWRLLGINPEQTKRL